MKKRGTILAALLLAVSCIGVAAAQVPPVATPPEDAIDDDPAVATLQAAARDFVPLTLEAGTYEADYVDSYYGPEELRTAAQASPRSREALIAAAEANAARLARIIPALEARFNGAPRSRMLHGQYVAAATRLRMIGGERLPFAAEAQGLFATQPVLQPLSHYDAILARLSRLVPGRGTLAARVDAFNDRYVIPTDRLQPVFDAAIAECRRRTAQFISLPEGESFRLEFVTGKSWSGYNYYQGGYRSLIQVNTDLPIRISRAVDLGCHEGYPGHHVLNLLIESELVNKSNWREYQVNPLYSPQSVISEGSANYGIDLAFPGDEKLIFERDVLYPLAGLDPSTAAAFYRVSRATEELAGARLTIAQRYLDGQISRAQAVELTQRYLLVSAARAEQSVAFTDHYRSYVINYGWGKQLVRDYVERAASPAARWARMREILVGPTLPADLISPAPSPSAARAQSPR